MSEDQINVEQVVKFILVLLGWKHTRTKAHCIHVGELAVDVAHAMGLSAKEVELIRVAGLVHDIGKVILPRTILLKVGALTDIEYQEVQSHCAVGDRMLRYIEHEFFDAVAPLVRHHHENMDGSGYPDRIAGGKIPLGARILRVTDSYEAMTQDRHYHEAISHRRALRLLYKDTPSHYDAEVMKAFMRVVDGSQYKGKYTPEEEAFS